MFKYIFALVLAAAFIFSGVLQLFAVGPVPLGNKPSTSAPTSQAAGANSIPSQQQAGAGQTQVMQEPIQTPVEGMIAEMNTLLDDASNILEYRENEHLNIAEEFINDMVIKIVSKIWDQEKMGKDNPKGIADPTKLDISTVMPLPRQSEKTEDPRAQIGNRKGAGSLGRGSPRDQAPSMQSHDAQPSKGFLDTIADLFIGDTSKSPSEGLNPSPLYEAYTVELEAKYAAYKARRNQAIDFLKSHSDFPHSSRDAARIMNLDLAYFVMRNAGSMHSSIPDIRDMSQCRGDAVRLARYSVDRLLTGNYDWSALDIMAFQSQLSGCLSADQTYRLDLAYYYGYPVVVGEFLDDVYKAEGSISYLNVQQDPFDTSNPAVGELDLGLYNVYLSLHDLNKFRGDMSFLWLGQKRVKIRDDYQIGSSLFDRGTYLWNEKTGTSDKVLIQPGGDIIGQFDVDYYLTERKAEIEASGKEFTKEIFTPFMVDILAVKSMNCGQLQVPLEEPIEMGPFNQNITDPVMITMGSQGFIHTALRGVMDLSICGQFMGGGTAGGAGGGITCASPGQNEQHKFNCSTLPPFQVPGGGAMGNPLEAPGKSMIDVRQLWANARCANVLGEDDLGVVKVDPFLGGGEIKEAKQEANVETGKKVTDEDKEQFEKQKQEETQMMFDRQDEVVGAVNEARGKAGLKPLSDEDVANYPKIMQECSDATSLDTSLSVGLKGSAATGYSYEGTGGMYYPDTQTAGINPQVLGHTDLGQSWGYPPIAHEICHCYMHRTGLEGQKVDIGGGKKQTAHHWATDLLNLGGGKFPRWDSVGSDVCLTEALWGSGVYTCNAMSPEQIADYCDDFAGYCANPNLVQNSSKGPGYGMHRKSSGRGSLEHSAAAGDFTSMNINCPPEICDSTQSSAMSGSTDMVCSPGKANPVDQQMMWMMDGGGVTDPLIMDWLNNHQNLIFPKDDDDWSDQ